MEITTQLKQDIRAAMLAGRENYGGSDTAFAKSLNISPAVYSRIKTEKLRRFYLRANG